MNRLIAQLGMASLLVGLMMVSTFAGKPKKLNKSDLPPAVLVSFESLYPKASIKSISQERKDSVLYYEIECQDAGSTRNLLYTLRGAVYELEEEIGTNSLPDSVYYAIRGKAPHGKIVKAERVTRGTVVEYEILVEARDTLTEYIIDAGGRVLPSTTNLTKSAAEEDEDEDKESDDDEE